MVYTPYQHSYLGCCCTTPLKNVMDILMPAHSRHGCTVSGHLDVALILKILAVTVRREIAQKYPTFVGWILKGSASRIIMLCFHNARRCFNSSRILLPFCLAFSFRGPHSQSCGIDSHVWWSSFFFPSSSHNSLLFKYHALGPLRLFWEAVAEDGTQDLLFCVLSFFDRFSACLVRITNSRFLLVWFPRVKLILDK